MKSLLLVPDGVSLRNFVLGATAGLLADAGGVTVWADPSLPALDDQRDRFTWDTLDAYPERLVEASLRRTLEYAHLRTLDTPGSRFVLAQPIPGTPRSRALRLAARTASQPFGTLAGVRRLVTVHDRLADRRPEVDIAARRLAAVAPDVVLCAHQRPLAVLPVVLAARRLGIPTATFVFSWDNLTTKGRMAAPFDHFLVWSDHMAAELRRFYPDAPADRVHVVGTPQFDPYAEPDHPSTRAALAARLALDPGRPIVCFTAGDAGTCPDDPYHLSVLLELVRSGLVHGDPQVVLRTAPVDPGDRFDGVRRDYPELVDAAPNWSHGDGGLWHTAYPTREDVVALSALTAGADVNVNMASTMSIDFALRDTPVVNIGFDHHPEDHRAGRYYRFTHYRPVVELGAVRVAGDAAQLAEQVSRYLREPELDRDGRQALVDLELGVPMGRSSAAVVAALEAIADRCASR
ncbi:MAG: hypothetical protein ACXWCM_05685 [Acidimicrobiales bacterium]